MVGDFLRVLALALALLAAAPAGAFADAAPAGALGMTAGAAAADEGSAGGRVWRWADQYLNFFSDGSPPTTRRPSCGARDCPSGTQCCCCGDRCYCKDECSLQPCDGGR